MLNLIYKQYFLPVLNCEEILRFSDGALCEIWMNLKTFRFVYAMNFRIFPIFEVRSIFFYKNTR